MARILMVVPTEWHELAQRFHHVARHLAARHDVTVLAPRSHQRLVREGRWGELFKPFTREVEPGGLVVVSVPTLPFYRRHPRLVRRQWRTFPARLAAAALAQAADYDVLWIADPLAGPLADLVPHRALVYECVDDHAGFWEGPGLGAEVRAAETALVRRAARVVATAPALAERLRTLNRHTAHVGNGVDLARFAGVEGPGPDDAPTVGFYGMLGAWVDLGLVAELARRRPGWRFVLIGPVAAPLEGLDARPNVRLVPPVPYEALPGWLAQATTWLVPFRDSALTRAVDPLKAYEYLAAGRRVVASPLPALEPLGELVARAAGVEAWEAAIAAAIAQGPATGAEREAVRARLADRDWGAIAGTLEAIALDALA